MTSPESPTPSTDASTAPSSPISGRPHAAQPHADQPHADQPHADEVAASAAAAAGGKAPSGSWMPSTRPRRFYKTAEARPLAPTEGTDTQNGWSIFLDGRPVRTPSRQPLRLPTAALADAIAAEWAAQGEHIEPDFMPLTRFANTALEKVTPDRTSIITALLDYVDTDMLCYRADQTDDLSAHQMTHWQPLLDWAETVFSARLAVTHGIMPIRQPHTAVDALRVALETLDDWTLTGAQGAAAAASSLVLGLALAHGRVDGETCFTLSRLDETWQMEQWGEDPEAARAREAVRRDILAAETLIRLSRASAE